MLSMSSSSVLERDKGKQVSVEALTNLCDEVIVEDEEDSGLVMEEGDNESSYSSSKWGVNGGGCTASMKGCLCFFFFYGVI